ncbi:MAG: NTP transferase domain-containing protein [Cyanobacteriota bacterium]|nr:NTP transferase domain-containing protein [Cyanobacteriota bacterium]
MSKNQQHPGYFALILAAGSSTRMGSDKALLPWGDHQTLLSFQIRQWLNVGVTPIVIAGSHTQISVFEPHCLGQKILLNPHPEMGKISSLRIGLQGIPRDFQVLAISAIDQPRPDWVYQKLLSKHLDYTSGKGLDPDYLITAPSHHRKLGHPLFFYPQIYPSLLAIQESSQGLRAIIQRFYSQIQQIEMGSPIIFVDLNTPFDYQAQRENSIWVEGCAEE